VDDCKPLVAGAELERVLTVMNATQVPLPFEWDYPAEAGQLTSPNMCVKSFTSLLTSPPLCSSLLCSPLLASPHLSSPLLTSPLLSSPLLYSPLLPSLLLSSPLLTSSPLLSSPFLSSPISYLLTSPLIPSPISSQRSSLFLELGDSPLTVERHLPGPATRRGCSPSSRRAGSWQGGAGCSYQTHVDSAWN